jgi:hypothetical protein
MVSLTDSDTAPWKKEMLNTEQCRIPGRKTSYINIRPKPLSILKTTFFLDLLFDREAILLLPFAPFFGILW